MIENIVNLSEKVKKFLSILVVLFIIFQYFFVPIITSRTIIIIFLLFLINIKIGKIFYYSNFFNEKLLLILISKITFAELTTRVVITECTQLEIFNLFFIYLILAYSIFIGYIGSK